MQYDVVWLKEERRFAFLIQQNAFYSLVYTVEDGVETSWQVENDDYELWEERAIDFEQE